MKPASLDDNSFRVIPTLLFLLFIFTSCILQAQQNQPSSEILSQSQVSSIINDGVRKQSGIDFTIFGFISMSTAWDSGKLRKVWEINDHAIHDPKIEGVEQSISFWTKYIEFTDFDGDGLIEPIIVYGSKSDSDLASGRIKFIIYYKGKKVAIPHQDSDLDEGRSTQIDKEFYTLPPKLKESVKNKVLAMNKAGQAIFEKTAF
jgi:hypothetical protein